MARKAKGGKREQALAKLDRVEEMLLNAQANLPGMLSEVREVKEMLDPPPSEEKKADPAAGA